MDITTLGAAIAIAKKLPDTAAGRAEAAAERAEEAAEEVSGYTFDFSETNGVVAISRRSINNG